MSALLVAQTSAFDGLGLGLGHGPALSCEQSCDVKTNVKPLAESVRRLLQTRSGASAALAAVDGVALFVADSPLLHTAHADGETERFTRTSARATRVLEDARELLPELPLALPPVVAETLRVKLQEDPRDAPLKSSLRFRGGASSAPQRGENAPGRHDGSSHAKTTWDTIWVDPDDQPCQNDQLGPDGLLRRLRVRLVAWFARTAAPQAVVHAALCAWAMREAVHSVRLDQWTTVRLPSTLVEQRNDRLNILKRRRRAAQITQLVGYLISHNSRSKVTAASHLISSHPIPSYPISSEPHPISPQARCIDHPIPSHRSNPSHL